MTQAQCVEMLRRLADEVAAMPATGWDHRVEARYPALLGVLSLLKRLGF